MELKSSSMKLSTFLGHTDATQTMFSCVIYVEHIQVRFSISPLPRLHHHDIMTIVKLFFIP